MLTNIGNQSWNVCETWCWNKFSDVGMVDGYQCKTTDCCFPMLVIVYGIPTLVNITVYQHWKIMIGYQWHTNDTTIMFQWYHNIGKCFFFLPVAVYLQTVRYSKLICFAQYLSLLKASLACEDFVCTPPPILVKNSFSPASNALSRIQFDAGRHLGFT